MKVLRTPDECFKGIKDYPFDPVYTNIETKDDTILRIHHIDEGPSDGPILLAMHGQPVWSYLYARMIPFLVNAGIRVIAPDLPGYGKSDKPASREDYSFQNQVDWMGEWLKENNFSRTLTKRNSLYLGLSSMIGAGLFYNLAPTSKISSYSSILGLLLASTLAFANASSSAQLASLYPQTGGTYLYANKVLGKLPGNIAGIVFILGKTVSCVAIALTLGNYISPIYGKELGVGLSVIVFLIGYKGITKTAALARWFVLIVISILAFFCIAILMTPSTNIAIPLLEGFSASNLFLSAAIWFFAFTGYSRLATYGEEIKNPETIIPSSILTGLGITVTIYLFVNWLSLAIIGPEVVANSNTPLLVAMDVSVMSDFSFLIVFASTIATASVFLALLPAISRIYVAMSRDGILPNMFSKNTQ